MFPTSGVDPEAPASGQGTFVSGAMGDADWQPETGNVLMVNGWMAIGGESVIGRIFEVTPSGERIFDLAMTSAEPYPLVAIYRAQRLADIRN